MERNKIIIIALIVVIVALIVGLVAVLPNYGKEKSNLTMVNAEKISQGDSIKVELTDVNGTPIENETVNVTIKDENGTQDQQKVAVTNKKGVAQVKVDVEETGNYTVECTFEGNDNFTEDTVSEVVEVVEDVEPEDTQDTSEDADPGAFYSAQEGRIIYTGEVHEGPDGHRYKHLGYNEWEMVD